ncbi:transposase [Bacillus sp. X1(2014)]|uniref:transposase n=1 Tax=Bacillus sp. X1(2014) TaxID=1565991 RepID=UPI0011A36208|nr:transposase [Bacillus sp. X1(2014)]
MAKFSAEDKLAAVHHYLEGNDSYRTIGASIGAASSLCLLEENHTKKEMGFLCKSCICLSVRNCHSLNSKFLPK